MPAGLPSGKMPPKAGKGNKGQSGKNNNEKGKDESDDDKCAVCMKTEKETDEGVGWATCLLCNKWHHFHCLTNSSDLQKILEEDSNVFVRCQKCQQVEIPDDLSINECKIQNLQGASNSSPLKSYGSEIRGLRNMVTALANEMLFELT